MAVKTLSDYFNSLNVPGMAQTFIPSQFASYECLGEYFKNSTALDYDYKQKFANLLLQEQDENAFMTRTFNKLQSVCIRKKYEWDTLYSSIIQEYNPIWNVDGTEKTEYSAEKEINQIGAATDIFTSGERIGTTTDFAIPYNGTEEKETGKATSQNTSYTDTNTKGTHTDTLDKNAHTVTITRQGNIGVTKTQELLQSQRDIAMFDFLDTVMKECIDAITIPIFVEKEDNFSGIFD